MPQDFQIEQALDMQNASLQDLLTNNGLKEPVCRGLITPEQIKAIQDSSVFGVAIMSHLGPRQHSTYLDPEKLSNMTDQDYLAAVDALSSGNITPEKRSLLENLGIGMNEGAVPGAIPRERILQQCNSALIS